MKPPKITPGWASGGWEIEQGHVPGSYRMLAIWALSGLAAVAVTNLGAWFGDLHAGMYAGAGIGTAGILTGAALYRRLEQTFTLPESQRWTDGRVAAGRLADVRTDQAHDADGTDEAAPALVQDAHGAGVRPEEDAVLLAAQIRTQDSDLRRWGR